MEVSLVIHQQNIQIYGDHPERLWVGELKQQLTKKSLDSYSALNDFVAYLLIQ